MIRCSKVTNTFRRIPRNQLLELLIDRHCCSRCSFPVAFAFLLPKYGNEKPPAPITLFCQWYRTDNILAKSILYIISSFGSNTSSHTSQELEIRSKRTCSLSYSSGHQSIGEVCLLPLLRAYIAYQLAVVSQRIVPGDTRKSHLPALNMCLKCAC